MPLALVAMLVAAALGSQAEGRSREAGWCGADRVATDRLPDVLAGPQVHVVYAAPAGGEDRFSASATPIVADLAALDAWWRREDPTRTPRFDVFAFPGCPGGLDGLDLSSFRLPHDAAYYRPIQERQSRLAGDLSPTFSNPAKKYLVYYDGEVTDPYDCGQSAVAPEAGGATAYSFVYLQAESCTHDLGAGEGAAGYAAHELVHNLGAVPDAAPHVCFEHSVCDWYWDVEMQFPTGDPIAKLILDYGRDDYYGHNGSWFDVQDSRWLVHVGAPLHQLTISTAGRGTGFVSSDAPGISCPGVCAIAWEEGRTSSSGRRPPPVRDFSAGAARAPALRIALWTWTRRSRSRRRSPPRSSRSRSEWSVGVSCSAAHRGSPAPAGAVPASTRARPSDSAHEPVPGGGCSAGRRSADRR